MRGSIVHFTAAVAALAFGSALPAQSMHCTQETVVGTYALAYQGTIFMPQPGSSQPTPVLAVGLDLVSIDAQGALTATGYQNVGGNATYYPSVPGTIKVNPDCTGTLDWSGVPAGSARSALIIFPGGDEINTLVLTSPLGSTTAYGSLKRISRVPTTVQPAPCSEANVFGTYTFQENGSLIAAAAVPFAEMSINPVTLDGTFTGTGILSAGGQSVPVATTTGQIQLNPDCTWTQTADVMSQGASIGQARYWGVVLDGGDTLWGIDLSQLPFGKAISLRTGTRVSYSDPPPTPTVTLTVSGSQNGTAYKTGDGFVLAITAPGYANQPVSVVQNGGRPVQLGVTDAKGNWTITGSWSAQDIGSYVQTWYVDAMAAAPTLTFSVVQ
jgi:hypothetical protein